MKSCVFLIHFIIFAPIHGSLNPRANPGCVRNNSDELRAALFLIHLEDGKIKLAFELFDREAYEKIGEESLRCALQKAETKFSADVSPILKLIEGIKNQKFKNQAHSADLPD